MKTKISMKKMLEMVKATTNQPIYHIGYCGWDFVFRLINKLDVGVMRCEKLPYYSAGVYGWNCDYYQIYLKNRKVIIATGYRSSAKFEQIPFKLVDKVNKRALEMLEELAQFDKLEKSNDKELRTHLRIYRELESLVNLVL